MRRTTEIFIPIPKTRNTHVKVEIDGDDLTGRVKESSFVKPVTSGIGTFSIVLSNAGGQLTGTYSPGSIVKFYADNVDGTTQQFWGRIDHIKDNIGNNGQVLEIKGRHRSYLLTESLICYSATNNTSTILKEIIDQLPESYGFTYSNVNTTTDSMSVNWNYKPFWDCVIEICNFAGFDCYVDDNLDFHYFEANSIINTTDAVVEGDNLIDSKGWGTDDYYEKTRVTVIGQGQDGLPIIHTAISPSEGDDIREVYIRDSSAISELEVKNLAELKLAEITNHTPQATIKSFGLETVKPGDNIWLLIPRQEVHGQYKIVKIIQKFGAKIGGWRTDLLIEKEEEQISQVISRMEEKSNRLDNVDGVSSGTNNATKYSNSWIFEFDDDSGTHLSTEINEGVLKTDGGSSGTWTSEVRDLPSDVSIFEVRAVGDFLTGTIYRITLDGVTYNEIKNKSYVINSGNKLGIEVQLNSAESRINSLVVLYS